MIVGNVEAEYLHIELTTRTDSTVAVNIHCGVNPTPRFAPHAVATSPRALELSTSTSHSDCIASVADCITRGLECNISTERNEESIDRSTYRSTSTDLQTSVREAGCGVHPTWLIPVPDPWTVREALGDGTAAYLVNRIDRLVQLVPASKALFGETEYWELLDAGMGFWVVPLTAGQTRYGLRYVQSRMFVPLRVNRPMRRHVQWIQLDRTLRRQFFEDVPEEAWNRYLIVVWERLFYWRAVDHDRCCLLAEDTWNRNLE